MSDCHNYVINTYLLTYNRIRKRSPCAQKQTDDHVSVPHGIEQKINWKKTKTQTDWREKVEKIVREVIAVGRESGAL